MKETVGFSLPAGGPPRPTQQPPATLALSGSCCTSAHRPWDHGGSALDPRHVHPTGDEARAFKACPSTK